MATNQNYPSPTLVRWGSVVAGAVIGVAVMILLTSLFVALGAEADAISRNLHWYGLASAVVALFVAGLLAGLLSGVRGVGSGIVHGLAAWGLILVVTLAFPFPQEFGLLQTFVAPIPELDAGPLWAAFLSLLVGAVAAIIGGILGGAMTPTAEEPPAASRPQYEPRPEQQERQERPPERRAETAPQGAPDGERAPRGRGRRVRS